MTYTLKTDSIRMMVVNYQLQRSKDASEALHPTEVAWSACEMFDHWLAQRDREVKAQAWDEGAEAGYDDAMAGREEKRNPYKEEA